jgi:hypothetical protein
MLGLPTRFLRLGLWLACASVSALAAGCGDADAGATGGSFKLVSTPGDAHRIFQYLAATSSHDVWIYGSRDNVAPKTLVHIDDAGAHDVAIDSATEMVVQNLRSGGCAAGPGAFWAPAFNGSTLLRIDASGHAEDHAAELSDRAGGANILVASYEGVTFASRANGEAPQPFYKLVDGHFVVQPAMPPGPLVSLRVTPDGAAWVVFHKDPTPINAGAPTLARFDCQAWTELPLPAGATADLNFAYASPTEVWKTVVRGKESGEKMSMSVTPWQVAKYDGSSFQLVTLASPADYGSEGDRKHDGLDYMAPLPGGKVAVLGLRQKLASAAETINVYLEQNAIDGTNLANDLTLFTAESDCGANCSDPPVLVQYIDGGNMVISHGRDLMVGAGN